MQAKNIKFMKVALGALLVALMMLEAWLFINFKVRQAIFVLLLSVFILWLIFMLFSKELKKINKSTAGIMRVLEKSEGARIHTEELMHKILMIIDDLPEGLLVVNKNNEVSILNKSAEKFLGTDRR